MLRLFRKGQLEPTPYVGAWESEARALPGSTAVAPPTAHRRPLLSARGELWQAIAEFLLATQRPAARTLSSVHEAVELTEGAKPVVLGFFEAREVAEYEAFVAAAKAAQGTPTGAKVAFAEVLEPSLIAEFEIVYTPMIFVFRPGHDALGYTGKYEPLAISHVP